MARCVQRCLPRGPRCVWHSRTVTEGNFVQYTGRGIQRVKENVGGVTDLGIYLDVVGVLLGVGSPSLVVGEGVGMQRELLFSLSSG